MLIFKSLIPAIFFILNSFVVKAQNEDTVIIISLEEILTIVLENHPVVKQAFLLDDVSKQEIRIARGSFDPKLKSQYDIKEFNDKTYYNKWNSALEVPIWLNTDLKIGYERNSGSFLSSENIVPENGLLYAGITVPLGQGMIRDNRRTVLRQAQIFREIATADKVKAINKIMTDVAKAYWNWFEAWHTQKLFQEYVELAEFRFLSVKQRFENGDAAAIDSLEANIFLQSRIIDYQQAQLYYLNSGIILSNFLWNENGEPWQFKENTIPISEMEAAKLMEAPEYNQIMNNVLTNHPEIIKIFSKGSQLEWERRLGLENLKPVLNLNYNFLLEPYTKQPEMNMFSNDYKAGIDFSFPLFLRKERAKLQLTNIKLIDNSYELENTRRTISNEVTNLFNEFYTIKKLISTQEQMVSNYSVLLEGEKVKFESGESSLFLVNTREAGFVDSRQKLLSQKVKLLKTKYILSGTAAVLYIEAENAND